jgi:hypothetical protein
VNIAKVVLQLLKLLEILTELRCETGGEKLKQVEQPLGGDPHVV